MANFMGCNNMMFGSRVRYGITYKTNQKAFTVYRRKYTHDFRVPIIEEDLEGSMGLDLNKHETILVSKIDKVYMLNSKTFKEFGQIPITLLKTETREPNQIIAMRKSMDENFIAIMSGKNLIKKEQKINQLFIFKKKVQTVEFELFKRIVVKDIPIFNKTCMQFYFEEGNGKQNIDSIIFVKADRIIKINFEVSTTENPQIVTLHEFSEDVALKKQPEFFLMNKEQNIMITASPADGIYVDFRDPKNVIEIDLDQHFEIGCIKEIIFDHEDHVFYFLANKYKGKLGFFLIRMDEKDPKDHRKSKFMTKWKNKLDLGDASLNVIRHYNRDKSQMYKELVIAYKTIYINTYNVTVMDISNPNVEQTTLFRHESF